MYNNEVKMAFIAASYPEAKWDEAVRLLELFAPHEEAWGSDLVRQHIDQLQPAFDAVVDTITASKAQVLLPILRKYRKWYLEQHPNAVCAGVALLKLNLVNKLRDRMVASPLHLKLALDDVFDPPERETLDCVFRGYFWLAFAGVPQNQAALLTADEVDFYNLQIHIDGKDYKIYPEGLATFHKLCELDTFLYVHTNPNYEQRRPRSAKSQLLRGFGEQGVEMYVLSKQMNARFSKSTWSLSYENVMDSGFYYEKYELERIGQEVNFEEETAQRLSELTESTEAALKVNKYSIPRRFWNDYRQWKSLFQVAS